VRPVVLAPLALRDALRDTRRGAPGTLNAARGPRAGRARRRVLRPLSRSWGFAEAARACCWFESCERAHAPRQPRLSRLNMSGGCHGACAFGCMTRTNNKPSFRSRSHQRTAVLAERGSGGRRFLSEFAENILTFRMPCPALVLLRGLPAERRTVVTNSERSTESSFWPFCATVVAS